MTLINILISTIIFSLIISVSLLFLYFMPQLSMLFGEGVYVVFCVISLAFSVPIFALAYSFKRG